jgi:hypothetical protein
VAAEQYHGLPAETQPELRERIVVQDDTFFDYLLPVGPLADAQTGFAAKLDLHPLTPSLQEIYSYSPQSMRENEEEETFLHAGQLSNPGTLSRQRNPNLQESGETVSLVEWGRTVYCDPENATIQITEIVEGQPSAPGEDPTVEPGVLSTLRDGHIPLLPVHVHPENGMLNDFDYAVLLQKAYPDGQPAVRASMVLCPDMQILAVATNETPAPMESDQIDAFLEHWDKRFKNEDREGLEMLETKAIQVAEAGKVDWQTSGDQSMAYDPNNNPEYSAMKQEILAREQQAYHRVHMEIARAMGVAIYTSTDMTTFTRATA